MPIRDIPRGGGEWKARQPKSPLNHGTQRVGIIFSNTTKNYWTMTVRELYNWCKACRHKDPEVYLCKDWEEGSEDGCLTDLYKLNDICTQTSVIDDGLDFVDVHEVILSFDEVKAGR